MCAELNEEKGGGDGGGGVKAGVSALISSACLSFSVPQGWVRRVRVTLNLCVCSGV